MAARGHTGLERGRDAGLLPALKSFPAEETAVQAA